jgi:hypothetical protein
VLARWPQTQPHAPSRSDKRAPGCPRRKKNEEAGGPRWARIAGAPPAARQSAAFAAALFYQPQLFALHGWV